MDYTELGYSDTLQGGKQKELINNINVFNEIDTKAIPLDRINYDFDSLTSASAFGNLFQIVTTDGDITVTCGFRPSRIKITAFAEDHDAGWSVGIWNTPSTYAVMSEYQYSGAFEHDTSTDYIVRVYDLGRDYVCLATITDVDDTSFAIHFDSTVGFYMDLIWEAYK